ncbi:MAG: NAD(P)-dependent alcohol dehydrogenase [Chloroflexota bacterium]
MQAIVSDRYGTPDVMALRQIEKPVPADNEVLVKVVATGLNALDWHLLLGEPFFMRFTFGMFRPKITILGADMAGIVETVGKDVKRFKPGDAVFGDMVERGIGGLAEYVTVPENLLVAKPVNLTFQETSTIPVAATTALQGLRDVGGLQPGMKVLINGASGGVGTWAVQIAKALGAEVTAVCSTSKMDQARMLGADHVIDYTQEDFTRNDSSMT